jgi:hypothetical protein
MAKSKQSIFHQTNCIHVLLRHVRLAHEKIHELTVQLVILQLKRIRFSVMSHVLARDA